MYWYIITTITIDIVNEFKWKLICIAIGPCIPADKGENVSLVCKALNQKRKSESFTEEDTESTPRLNSDEFSEFQSDTRGSR